MVNSSLQRGLNLIGLASTIFLGEKISSAGFLVGSARDIASGAAVYNLEGILSPQVSPEVKLGVSLFANYGYEILQGLHALPGNFDLKDFASYTMGALISYGAGKLIQYTSQQITENKTSSFQENKKCQT